MTRKRRDRSDQVDLGPVRIRVYSSMMDGTYHWRVTAPDGEYVHATDHHVTIASGEMPPTVEIATVYATATATAVRFAHAILTAAGVPPMIGTAPTPPSANLTEQAAHAIGRALAGRRWRGRSERDISDEMDRVLAAAVFSPPMTFARELVLTAADRLDFAAVIADATPDLIAIEVKINRCSLAEAARQCQRYLAHDRVGALILATTSARLAATMPREMQGKPIYPLVLPRM